MMSKKRNGTSQCQFQVGDIVALNSGSGPLKVTKVQKDNVTVTWPDVEGHVWTETYPAVCLEPWREVSVDLADYYAEYYKNLDPADYDKPAGPNNW